MIEIAHQCRTRLAAGHMPRRATHVDVDDRGTIAFGDARAFRHPARLAAGELHHMHADALPLRAQHRVAAALDQLGTGGHFRDHEPGAKLRHQAPERRVGDA
jgi:hypothetical protein